MSDGSERKFLLACGVLDEAGQEDSLERLTAGIVSPIFSNSLFAHVTVAGSVSPICSTSLVRLYWWNCSVSGLPTVVSSTESRGMSSVVSIFGLSVETSGTSVGVGASCGIELLVGVVFWS